MSGQIWDITFSFLHLLIPEFHIHIHCTCMQLLCVFFYLFIDCRHCKIKFSGTNTRNIGAENCSINAEPVCSAFI